MFKKVWCGIAFLAMALFSIIATAEVNYSHCTSAKTETSSLKAPVCDVSFSAIPFFSNMCLAEAQSGIYTVTNNTPGFVTITYIRLQINDTLPAAASSIVAAPINNCVVGTRLAPHASCNIQVNLLSLTPALYNRTLQVGVNTRQRQLSAPTINAATLGCAPIPPAALGPPYFPVGFDWVVLAGSTITNTGLTSINGNVGLDPGSAITGFGSVVQPTGTVHVNDAAAIQAKADLLTAITALSAPATPCGTNLSGIDLGTFNLSNPLPSGVYCFDTSAQLTGALVLSGAGDHIFQIGTTLITAGASTVTNINGATNDRTFWVVGSSATLGTGSIFRGIILADQSITITGGVDLRGRAFASIGAVTLDTNVVNPNTP